MVMECEKAREEFSALLDGELTPDVREAVEAHLSQCSDCLRELGGFKRVDTLYRELGPERAPEDFEQRVHEALRPRLLRFGPRRHEALRIWPALAAAAVFVVITAGLAYQFQRPESGFELAKTSPTMADQLSRTQDKGQRTNETAGLKKMAEESAASGVLADRDFGRAEPAQESAGAGVAGPAAEPEAISRPAREVAEGRDEVHMIVAGKPVESIVSAEAESGQARARPETSDSSFFRRSDAPKRRSEVKDEGAASVEADAITERITENAPADAFQSLGCIAKAPTEGVSATEPQSTAGAALPASPPPATPQAKERMEAETKLNELTAQDQPVTRERFVLGGEVMTPSIQGESRRQPASNKPAEVKTMAAATPLAAAKTIAVLPAKTAAGRTLQLRDGVWQEKDYDGEPVKVVSRESDVIREMVRQHSELNELLALKEPVIFRQDNRWYRVEK
ncbi:MAG: zf-HC2 domain-containing protein [Candidatus Hydrogenedentes bacterium]|nr:zf-HC2 domain-containing protein [Candidatus Hydrogenedentota bacterium]